MAWKGGGRRVWRLEGGGSIVGRGCVDGIGGSGGRRTRRESSERVVDGGDDGDVAAEGRGGGVAIELCWMGMGVGRWGGGVVRG